MDNRIDMIDQAMDKAVVLARGLGTRMRCADDDARLDERQAAIADTGVKALIPIGRPFLDFVLSGLADAGYRRVCLVVAPDHETLRRYYEEEVQPHRVRIEFAVQAEPKGTADAVAAAEAFAGDDPFLVINSDNYYAAEALGGLRELDSCGTALFGSRSLVELGNIPAERVRQFGVGSIDEQGFLRRVLEKPDPQTMAAMGADVWVSMNCWRFGPSIFEACRRIEPSPRGELEITSAVQYAIDALGESFRVLKIRGAVLDMTSRRDIASVAERLSGVEVRL